ncbi:MAG: ATP-dependent DNA helicase RecG [Candidatus Omnitrophica bacterium]|nr:ATP-dependent DNA helicase RecG [Candidatus Omnitrophota bacterium]
MDIRYLKGVGPKRADILRRLEIRTTYDMLYYLPRRYEDRSRFILIKDVKPGAYVTLRARVLFVSSGFTRRNMRVLRLAIGDKTGVIYCAWFNQPFLGKLFKKDQDIVVYGKAERYDRLQINHPEYEIIQEEKKDSLNIGRIVPIYPLTQDVTQKYLRYLACEAVATCVHTLVDILPINVRARRALTDICFAIRNIHFPASYENLERARKRIIFEEFFILQAALAMKRKNIKEDSSGITHSSDEKLLEGFKELLPFELTSSQVQAVREIQSDMADTKPMNRLLEGDVGSGKTVVAAYALLISVKNGYQASIMAPTEILARQHYITLSELLMPLGVNVRLLVSGLGPDKKEEIRKEILCGEAEIVVGTHALLWEGIEFKSLGMAVIDEQHKFGVAQRRLLKQKGKNPDCLVMTATPIPRTLALTVYGDLDISVIRGLPGGRLPITTYCMEEDKRESVYKFIREEIEKGRQVYIVYPRIRQKSEAGPKSATAMYNRLQEEVFPDLKLGLIHGKMSSGEKDKIMKKFKGKKIHILVSTIVIEVGIDVPNASLMVIENAENFGLSQLHQLRGRIGRGDYPSSCILMGRPRTDAARKRFFTMSETQDGFRIAEEDLELRGPGEFLGTRQHGLPELRFGNILRDFDIMEEARKDAFELIKRDPDLKEERNKRIKEALKTRFKGKLELVNVG